VRPLRDALAEMAEGDNLEFGQRLSHGVRR
jgi:hypothetical protein